MPEFVVRWEINIDAKTPEEAAREALTIMLDPESTATVFDVYRPSLGQITMVDLAKKV